MEKTIDGYTFELEGEGSFDEEHDQTPEAGLWEAARKLRDELISQGYENADRTHSEKGWVEVNLNEDES